MQIFFARVLPWVRVEFFVTQFFSRKKFVFIRKLDHYLSENKGFDPLLHILWGMDAFIVDILFSSRDKFI